MRPGMAQGDWVLSFRVLWLMLGLFNFLSVDYADCLCLANESRALLALKGENQLEALSSWKEGSDCCRGWAGVSCDTSATHVVALKLTVRSQLRNVHIPKTVCDFYELQGFSISIGSSRGNGDIPICLWNMTKMRYLSISDPMATKIGYHFNESGRQGGIWVQGSLPAQVCNRFAPLLSCWSWHPGILEAKGFECHREGGILQMHAGRTPVMPRYGSASRRTFDKLHS